MKKITYLLVMIIICHLAIGQPTNNAPDPTNKAIDVISIYGGSFTNVATNYNPFWNQSGAALVDPSFDPGTGNLVLAYPNFNYQGTELSKQNASGMEYLHIDIWTSDATNVKVTPINDGATGTGVGEVLVEVPLIKGEWSSVDLPKSAFVGMTWDAVFQIKFDGQGGFSPSTIYLDNIYFWKTPTPVGADATLSDLKVDGNTITGFAASAYNYTFPLVIGTTQVPQITLATTTDAKATVTSITQATTIPGDAQVVVTSESGNVVNTYTVSFIANLPTPSPKPTTPDNEVLSIYCDTGGFNNKWYRDYNFGAYSSITDLDQTSNVNEAIKMDFSVSGYGEGKGNITDISDYNYIHFDYFADADSNQIKINLIKKDNNDVLEYTYELTTAGSDGTIVKGSWQSVDIPLSFFEGIGFNKTQFFQYKLFTGSTFDSKIVYFDNIYFSKNIGTILSNTNFKSVGFTTYPNPTDNAWTIASENTIKSVQLFDVLGKKIQDLQTNNEKVEIDATSLSKGIYFGRITTDEGTSVIKLRKN